MTRRLAISFFLSLLIINAQIFVRSAEAGPSQAVKAQGSRYSCPMHAEVKSRSAGTCYKCGMALRVTTADAGRSEREAEKDDIRFHIPDTTVYDQDGNRLRFYTDLVKGKTVVINFIFTTCTTICPPLTATMRKVQQDLGARAGRDVWLISVSVDPAIDVPQRLKSFSQRFNAAEGWVFVTGGKSEVDLLLKSLGAYSGTRDDHTPMILIGNDSAGYWTRTYGLAPPQTIIKLVSEANTRSSGSR